MDLSKPEFALGILNATVSVSSIGYFYYKLNQNDKNLKDIEESFSEINDNMVEIEGNFEKVRKVTTKMNSFMDQVRNSFSQNESDLKHFKNLLEYQQECIEAIAKKLKSSDSSFELPDFIEQRRQQARSRRMMDIDDSNDDDFRPPRRTARRTTANDDLDEDLADTGKRRPAAGRRKEQLEF